MTDYALYFEENFKGNLDLICYGDTLNVSDPAWML